MTEFGRLLAGLVWLEQSVVPPGRVYTLKSGGIGIDCTRSSLIYADSLKSLGWTWDCETSTYDESDVCWKFFFIS